MRSRAFTTDLPARNFCYLPAIVAMSVLHKSLFGADESDDECPRLPKDGESASSSSGAQVLQPSSGVPESQGHGAPVLQPSSGVPSSQGHGASILAPQIDVAASESESEDIWAKVKPKELKPKGQRPTLSEIFTNAYQAKVNKLASQMLNAASKAAKQAGTEAAKAPEAATVPESVSTAAAGNGAKPDGVKPDGPDSGRMPGKPAGKKPSGEKVEKVGKIAAASPETPRAPTTETSTIRAPRGTANTFAGRRPPKDPAKLAVFMAKRDAYQKAKEEAKALRSKGVPAPRHSDNQKEFMAHMADVIKKQGGGRDAFKTAAGSWTAKKRPAAAPPCSRETAKQNSPSDVPESVAVVPASSSTGSSGEGSPSKVRVVVGGRAVDAAVAN